MKKCKKVFNGLASAFSISNFTIKFYLFIELLILQVGLILLITGFSMTHVHFSREEFPYFGLFGLIPIELFLNIRMIKKFVLLAFIYSLVVTFVPSCYYNNSLKLPIHIITYLIANLCGIVSMLEKFGSLFFFSFF